GNYIFVLENPESVLENKTPVSAAPNNEPPEVRLKFQKMADAAKQEFIKKYPEYRYLPRRPQERKRRTLERNDSSMTIGGENLEISSEITKLSSLLNDPQQQLERPDPMGSPQNYVDYHTMLNTQNTDDFALTPLDANYLPLPSQTLHISTSTDVENFKKLLFDMPLTNSPEQINYSDPIYYSSSNSSSQCSLFQNSTSTDSQQQFEYFLTFKQKNSL
ncbi:23012_t:CDS:2, partial [Gigaspora margarita]